MRKSYYTNGYINDHDPTYYRDSYEQAPGVARGIRLRDKEQAEKHRSNAARQAFLRTLGANVIDSRVVTVADALAVSEWCRGLHVPTSSGSAIVFVGGMPAMVGDRINKLSDGKFEVQA